MKRFNFKDRKILTLGLGLVLVCVFTLTVAYSALSAVLTVNGNARVSAADWDIYLNNPRVTNGSATTDVPVIKTSSTLEFETTLNMPGDFYEFVVDVVNGGDIDAMIENVVKTPDLTAEQAKFLKYEVSYQNGEAITTKQLLAKDTTMPVKVRIEYRKDLNNTDLPTGQVVLDLALTLEYIQSDGTGSTVTNNGVQVKPVANGDINEIGTIVTIGAEEFYTIGTEGDNVKLLSAYNIYVGNKCSSGGECTPLEDTTGMQSVGLHAGNPGVGQTFFGTVPFASEEQKGINSTDYSGSIVEGYVNNYANILEEKFEVSVEEARLLNYDDLVNTFLCDLNTGTCATKDQYDWLFNTTTWTNIKKEEDVLYYVYVQWSINSASYSNDYFVGVRPVIIISKDYF